MMEVHESNDMSSFTDFDFSEKQLIYRGLLSLVNSNSGFGFQNNDQGHPAYAIGRSGQYDYAQWGDSPEHNKLFRLMHGLSVELSEAELDESAEIIDYVFCWADFCSLACAAYEKHKNKG